MKRTLIVNGACDSLLFDFCVRVFVCVRFAYAQYEVSALCSAFYLFLINKFTHEASNTNHNNDDMNEEEATSRRTSERKKGMPGYARECCGDKNVREPRRRRRCNSPPPSLSLCTLHKRTYSHTCMHRELEDFFSERITNALCEPYLWFERVHYLCMGTVCGTESAHRSIESHIKLNRHWDRLFSPSPSFHTSFVRLETLLLFSECFLPISWDAIQILSVKRANWHSVADTHASLPLGVSTSRFAPHTIHLNCLFCVE